MSMQHALNPWHRSEGYLAMHDNSCIMVVLADDNLARGCGYKMVRKELNLPPSHLESTSQDFRLDTPSGSCFDHRRSFPYNQR
jgi:hypothetical protein